IVKPTKPSNINITDGRLPNIPDMNAQLAVQYASPASVKYPYRLSASFRRTGRSRLGIGPDLGRWQGGFSDVDLDAALTFGRTELYIGVANLFDTGGNRFALGSLAQPGAPEPYVPQPPRYVSLGVRVGGRWAAHERQARSASQHHAAPILLPERQGAAHRSLAQFIPGPSGGRHVQPITLA